MELRVRTQSIGRQRYGLQTRRKKRVFVVSSRSVRWAPANRLRRGPTRFLPRTSKPRRPPRTICVSTGLEWTIIRPGLLTDDDPIGEVTLAEPPVARGSVSRADVAAVIEALIDAPASVGKTLVLTSGSDLVRDAVDAL